MSIGEANAFFGLVEVGIYLFYYLENVKKARNSGCPVMDVDDLAKRLLLPTRKAKCLTQSYSMYLSSFLAIM